MRSSRQKASLDSKWFVNDPCGTPAARTMSRTVAPQYPCSRTTLKPSVSIFSRSDGLDMLAPTGLRRCCEIRLNSTPLQLSVIKQYTCPYWKSRSPDLHALAGGLDNRIRTY